MRNKLIMLIAYCLGVKVNFITLEESNANTFILKKENKKLKENLKDIIEAEEKKEVKIIYETSELKSKVIKDECTFKIPLTDEDEIESINGLMIKLLPYISNIKEDNIGNESTLCSVTKQITILTNKE